MSEKNINYGVAGGLLSSFATGNLLASFVNPILIKLFNRKFTVVFLSLLIPFSLLIITLKVPTIILYLVCITLGIGRGTVSITNNSIINNYDGSTFALNILHTIFAIGAFLTPILTSLYIENNYSWKFIIYTIVILCLISSIGYYTIPLNNSINKKSYKLKIPKSDKTYLKNFNYYIIGIILFFYLGAENCVNGWFVTYFKSTGIINDNYSRKLVSLTWLVIIIGRLFTAKISKKINANILILFYSLGTTIFFILLITSKNLTLITIAVIGIGFFFSGIYPTGISIAGVYIKNSNTGMSLLLAIAAFGGIITPQIIGIAADYIGLTGAILILTINILGMVIFSFINYFRLTSSNTCRN
jgi:fucose permease